MELDLSHILTLAVGAIFINNFVLARFLGLCPFIGVSKEIESSIGMSLAVIFVMTLAGIATFFVQKLLSLMGIPFMQVVAFIIVIAALVQFVEMFLQKVFPPIYAALGVYLPLITTNCAILGVAVLNVQEMNNLFDTVLFSFTAAVGFALAILLMAGIRERLELARVPKAFEGAPIAFVTAALLAVSFMGFSGMKF